LETLRFDADQKPSTAAAGFGELTN